ncbi:nucleotidyltransferase [Paenibacillus turpanensis]|uniref:nucleotidyltransferase n=1 Tax=Paenibacillus turpanensis TaxID=2689078 RepID=UPI001408CA4C|nr:nucleotidyltransferase [Paenibacillus turpanensis]
MKTVGIIVEYNPLHNGHVYHFQQSKMNTQADAVIAVMSGHFLQRGEPALASKWARAEMALRMGADLVLELPVAFSAQPAEWFAYGAVSALDATGVVDALCFGSEHGDLAALQALAQQLAREPDELRAEVKARLKGGASYPAAYAAAALASARSGDEPLPGAEAVAQPNNILGLHYLIALERLGSPITPATIARTKAGYHQADITDSRIASATAIRRLLFEECSLDGLAPFVPAYTLDILKREAAEGRGPIRWEAYARQLLHSIVTASPEQLNSVAEMTEGLEHRLKRAIASLSASPSEEAIVSQLLASLKTKRYTHVKLQRLLTRVLLSHSKAVLSREVLQAGSPYLRVLGFTGTGRELLQRMKKTARVPVITKVSRGLHPFLDLDIDATAVYAAGFRQPDSRQLLRDYYQAPIRV